jgi:hypothetical protein
VFQVNQVQNLSDVLPAIVRVSKRACIFHSAPNVLISHIHISYHVIAVHEQWSATKSSLKVLLAADATAKHQVYHIGFGLPSLHL